MVITHRGSTEVKYLVSGVKNFFIHLKFVECKYENENGD